MTMENTTNKKILKSERAVLTVVRKLTHTKDPTKKCELMWSLAWVQLRDLENLRPAGGWTSLEPSLSPKAGGGCLKRLVLLFLAVIPSIVIWLVAWRVIMPEGVPMWRIFCGWMMVWTGAELYNRLTAKFHNALGE